MKHFKKDFLDSQNKDQIRSTIHQLNNVINSGVTGIAFDYSIHMLLELETYLESRFANTNELPF